MFTDISEEIAADPWFIIVEMLQHHWAVIIEDDPGVLIVFYGDAREVFDELRYDSVSEAEEALFHNGFCKYLEDKKAADFIELPRGKFEVREHPNGRIYSSGSFWLEVD